MAKIKKFAKGGDAQGSFDFSDPTDLSKYGIKPRPGFDPSGPNIPEYRNYLDEVDTKDKAKEKAKTRAAENEDFKDKRQPRSELIQKAEMAKIKADADARDAAKTARAQSSMISPGGNTTAAGRGELSGRGGAGGSGGSGGSGGTAADMKMLLNPKAMKKGGAVKSASSRGDGCAQRGKTKGRMV
jgi:hypothetical protein